MDSFEPQGMSIGTTTTMFSETGFVVPDYKETCKIKEEIKTNTTAIATATAAPNMA